MKLQPDKLAQWPIPEGRLSYSTRDTILYALGIGCGMNPVDEAELQYVFEEGLQAFPSMAHVLGYPGFWMKDIDPAVGLDWRKMLHGEQTMKLTAPIPPSGSVVGRTRITGIYDKGEGRDAVILSQRDIEDTVTSRHLGHVTSTILVRGAGRLWRSARSGLGTQDRARHETRPDDRHTHFAAGSADLQIVWRHQPVACEPEGGCRRGLSAPDPAWPLHARRGHACDGARLRQ